MATCPCSPFVQCGSVVRGVSCEDYLYEDYIFSIKLHNSGISACWELG